MADLLLIADQRRCIKEIFGDLITSFDGRMNRYEHGEKSYEEAKQSLRDEMKRLHEGLKRLDNADSPERAKKITRKMVEIAKDDIPEKFKVLIETFTNLVLEYGEVK